MKKNYLFCTKWYMFLTELPPILLLIISLVYNSNVTNVFKLYPLIVFSCACIVFIFLFLFRAVSISTEEIRSIGLFSSKDSANINKNKELILTLEKKHKLRVSLFGNDGKAPELSWAQRDGYIPMNLNLYREKAIGSKSTLQRVLVYFGVDKEEAMTAVNSKSFEKEYDSFIVMVTTSEKTKELKIKFTQTI